MYWNRKPGDIVREWESEIETQLEVGARPLLSLGYNDPVTRNLAGLLALHALATKRRDVTAPVMPVGGSGLLWAAALLQPTRPPLPASPEITVRFTGADLATHTANLLLHEPERRFGAAFEGSAPPLAMSRWFAPRSVPGADAPWEALPFVVQPPDGSTHDVDIDWIGWAAILAASALALAAILF